MAIARSRGCCCCSLASGVAILLSLQLVSAIASIVGLILLFSARVPAPNGQVSPLPKPPALVIEGIVGSVAIFVVVYGFYGYLSNKVEAFTALLYWTVFQLVVFVVLSIYSWATCKLANGSCTGTYVPQLLFGCLFGFLYSYQYWSYAQEMTEEAEEKKSLVGGAAGARG